MLDTDDEDDHRQQPTARPKNNQNINLTQNDNTITRTIDQVDIPNDDDSEADEKITKQ